jgi:Spy/CpxP family protein refolding chaperone
MKRFYLAGGAVLLLVLLAFAWSSAQMDMGKTCKKEIMIMDQEKMSQKPCGGMMQPMGCCSMGPGMMGQMGCCSMGPGMGMGMCDGMMGCCQKEFFLCCKDKLELTDKQVQDLEKIKMDFMKGRFKTEADLKIAQLELKSLMDKEDAPIKDIEAKMNTTAKLETDMKLSHIKAFRQAKALLTAEQMEKMKKGMGM